MTEIVAYLGLGSRYSYLAFTQLARIEAAHRCTFRLQPLSSVELMQLRGRSPFEGLAASGQYEWPYRRADAQDWAAYYGVAFVEPAALPDDHRLMARACWAADEQGALGPYCAALFGALFHDGATVDAPGCTRLASRIGLDDARFEAAMTSAAVDRRVTETAEEAVRRGAFGVPTFFVGERMFWGNDRLVLLEHHLEATRRPNA